MINGLYSRAAAFAVALVALALAMAPAAHAQGKWRTGTPIPQGANEVIGAEIDGQVLVYGGQNPGNNAMGIFWKFMASRANGRNYRQIRCRYITARRRVSVANFTCSADSGFRTPARRDGIQKIKPGCLISTPRNGEPSADAYDARRTSGSGGLKENLRERWRGYSSGHAASRRPRRRWPGGPLRYTRGIDTDTNAWSKLVPMPTPRNHHNITYVDGKLYAIGGRVGSCYSGGWSSNVWMNEAYDIATNTWARARRCQPRDREPASPRSTARFTCWAAKAG